MCHYFTLSLERNQILIIQIILLLFIFFLLSFLYTKTNNSTLSANLKQPVLY
jgi:hypothetical protein